MKQGLCRRIGALEKISAAAAAHRVECSSDYEEKFARMMESVYAWHADPVNQQWLAGQPPEFLGVRVRELREELMEWAYAGGVAA